MESLKQLDTSIFFWFNSKHNSFFDTVMYWASHDYFWIWLYLIFLGFVFTVYKRRTLIILPIVALMVVVSDQSANVLKKSVGRYRPSHNLAIQEQVHLNPHVITATNDGRGGKYGFVSSHASNVFALAFFLSMLLMKRYRYFPLLIFLWAAMVGYSRIYNGVHYPADVLGGAFVGILSGFLAYRLWKYIEKKL